MSEVVAEASSVDIGRRAASRAETRMLIDGELTAAASGAEFDNLSPATGLLLGSTSAAGASWNVASPGVTRGATTARSG